MRVRINTLTVPTTSVQKLINELAAAIRVVGMPGGKASVACTEVMYLKTLLPQAARLSLGQASAQLVPTVLVRILVPPAGSTHSGVDKKFQDAIKEFGKLLSEELNEFVQHSEINKALRDRDIGKVLVEYKQHSAHGRETVKRSEVVISSTQSLDQPVKKKTHKAVA